MFDLSSPRGLSEFLANAGALLELSKAQEKELDSMQRAMLERTPLVKMTAGELRQYFWQPDQWLSRRDRRGLKELRRLGGLALEASDPDQLRKLTLLMGEVAAAITNNRRTPAPSSLDFVQVPLIFIDHSHNPVGRGRDAASNLRRAGSETDLSRIDPGDSTFWRRPSSIGTQDLYHGFGRTDLPRLGEQVCVYSGPKTSYGGSPGLEVRCGGQEIKVKFAETTSEPFVARIFFALGYHADPTDHAEYLKIKYDRRLLREFHLRKEIKTEFRLFAVIPVYTMKLQHRFDPFEYIAFAVMRDGSQLPGREVKAQLFQDPKRIHPEDDPENFRPEVEGQIDYLVTVPANIQVKDEASASIGPWDFGELGHAGCRELRGAALLAAWLGWFDSRFENTRLKIVERDGRRELAHFFSDLGGGLGRGKGFFSGCGELPNEFGWTFTRASVCKGRRLFRIVDFKPIADTAAFKAMTLDDARWMARLIGQLTEEQIIQALVASGFDSAQVRLYTEKLIGRRDQMIRDLALEGEIALLRPEGVELTFSYNPASEGAVEIRPAGTGSITAKTSDLIVERGKVVAGANFAQSTVAGLGDGRRSP
jgi:hypothetical protein